MRALLLLFGLAITAPARASDLGPLLERTYQRACHSSLRVDGALAAVARANSEALAELPAGEGDKHQSFLRFLLEKHAVREAVVLAHAARAHSEDALRQQLLGFLRRHTQHCDLTHLGLGMVRPPRARAASDGERVVTLLLLRRRVEIQRLVAVVGQRLRLCGQLVSGQRPRVLVTWPSGQVEEAAPRVPSRRFCVELPPASRGRHQVEVMVDGPFGPEVAALFPLDVGIDPPALPTEKLYPPESLQRERAEARLLALVNHSRAKAGRAALCSADRLTQVARAHSADMLLSGFFGHRAPGRGGLTKRLAGVGLVDLLASENLALSTSPARAHEALMASPSHRRNLLDPRLTHAGIGVAVDPGQQLLFISECFARLSDRMCH